MKNQIEISLQNTWRNEDQHSYQPILSFEKSCDIKNKISQKSWKVKFVFLNSKYDENNQFLKNNTYRKNKYKFVRGYTLTNFQQKLWS